MFDLILEKLKRFFSSRLLPIAIIYIALFFVLIHRIFVLQIVKSSTETAEIVEKNTKTREIKSTRGLIYDRNGVLLAYNALAYSVVIEDNSKLKDETAKNDMIYKLIRIIESNGDEIDVDFPIDINDQGELEYNMKEGTQLNRFRKTVFSGLPDTDPLYESYPTASAEVVFEYLRHGIKGASMFNIDDAYSKEDALKIMAIRYAIYSNFPKYAQITVATQVSEKTVAAIKENSRILIGVDIKQDSYRVYNDSVYFAHILGYTGKVSSEEIAAMKEEGYEYSSTDYIGKSGIEKYYETYLSGSKGHETVTVDALNKVVSIDDVVEPVAGNDLYLTIDSELQKAAYHILENKIAGVLVKNIVNSMSYGSKGDSASDITIPIYEVYYTLINNNVINIDAFSQNDATLLEQTVYQKYQTAFAEAVRDITVALDENFTIPNDKVNNNLSEYLTYIYEDILLSKGILMKNAVNQEDSTYQSYKDNKISLSEFLQYAISNNWVDLAALGVNNDYYSTDELYQMLVDLICKELVTDSNFNKIIYHNLIFNYKLSGKEICLLLFDQGVLEYNEGEVNQLKNGLITPYSFMIRKIRNLEITPAQLALEPCSGATIVTDPITGAVLATVSYPSYDNNKMANKVDSAYYAKLNSDLSTPLLNRATSSKSAPGSTYKMVVSIAGLSEGVVGVNETIKDLVVYTKADRNPKCWSKTSHGDENVVRALRDSCNYYFYEVGWRLGNGNATSYNSAKTLATLNKYATMFGLAEKTGIEIGEYAPQISTEDGIRSSIGQGNNNLAPIHLARYVSTLANGGYVYNLTLLDSIVDQNGKTILDNKAELINDISNINRTYWSSVQAGMYSVVNDGSVKDLFSDLSVKVAGKTGTAQESLSSPNHALFVSYAPYENPEISVTTVIRNGYASANAAEVASEVYKYYYDGLSLEEIIKDGASLENNSANTND